MNILRRIALTPLLIICGGVVMIGAGTTALAATLGSGPTPPAESLAQAVHGALAAPSIAGVTARIQFTNNLIEASALNTQSGDGAVSSSDPLISGGSGRLWISDTGEARVELQSEQGDTEIVYDNNTISLYDAATNSLYRYTLPANEGSGTSSSTGSGTSSSTGSGTSSSTGSGTSSSTGSGTSSSTGSGTSSSTGSGTSSSTGSGTSSVPTVAKIQEVITHLMGRVNLSGAQPGDVAGQPTYTVTISQRHQEGLLGSVQLAWDAIHGVPLRVAVYSTQSTTPVLELTATEVSYGPVASSVFDLTEPPGVRVTEIAPPTNADGSRGSSSGGSSSGGSSSGGTSSGSSGSSSSGSHTLPPSGLSAVQANLPFTIDAPDELDGIAREEVRLVRFDHSAGALVTYGHGLGQIAVIESQAGTQHQAAQMPTGGSLQDELPKVSIDGSTATEVPTALGTILSFERSSVDYVVAASLPPSTVQAAARGL